MRICCVEGCKSVKSNSRSTVPEEQRVSFHFFPPGLTRYDVYRRRLWVDAVTDRPDTIAARSVICGKHFVTGRPAKFNETSLENWIPTLLLGKDRVPPKVNICTAVPIGDDGCPDPEQVILHQKPILVHSDRQELDPFADKVDLERESEKQKVTVKRTSKVRSEKVIQCPPDASNDNDVVQCPKNKAEDVFFDEGRCLFCLNRLQPDERVLLDFNKEVTFKTRVEFVLGTTVSSTSYACCNSCRQMFVLFYKFKKSCLAVLSKPQELLSSVPANIRDLPPSRRKKDVIVLSVREDMARNFEEPPMEVEEAIEYSREEFHIDIDENKQADSTESSNESDHSSREDQDIPQEPIATQVAAGYRQQSRCWNCGEVFPNQILYSKHKEHCLTPEEPLQCPQCPKKFKKGWDLENHLNRHNGLKPYSCTTDGCGKSFASPIHLRTHQRVCNSTEKFICPVCGITFKKDLYLQRHLLSHEAPKFECGVCHRRFYDSTNFRGHMMKHFERNELPPEAPLGSDSDEYVCTGCKKAFDNAELLASHELYCRKESKYRAFQLKCPLCPEKFQKQEKLDQHINRHKGIKSVPCRKEGCTKTFFDTAGRNVHELYRCGKERDQVCAVCGTTHSSPAALRMHMKAHQKASLAVK